MGGQRSASYDQMALLWVLNLADGRHSLLDMAERAGVPFATSAPPRTRSSPPTSSSRRPLSADHCEWCAIPGGKK